MIDDLKSKARRVCLALAGLPDAKRAAAVASFCAGNAALRAEVEAMLRAGGDAGGRQVGPVPLPVPVASQGKAPAREQSGDRIGNYTLVSQIGEGGMGTIWLAEQREPIRRRVALKVIKRGMDTEQVVARFEAERQALAMMDHPNIAKVFDAGATESGRPYFVMEYIEGVPILEHCDQAKVDTRARLVLFTKVCQAIQHAHQKGVIHRDIKPSNVLVTLEDGAPAPKVIDFGIAKATSSEPTTRTLFTEDRQIVGTPAYMSPEQAEMSGIDVDTRTDIYSLGVLLYELLTGTTPFDVKDLVAKGFAEMMRTIREDEPHKPSTRISALGGACARTAMARSVDARRLGSQLRGDIDWIVMKCLEKDRSRRYETANGLAADILRHLRDEPVTAAAPGAGYRLRKFVKRNRGEVLACAVVAAALVLGVIGTTAAMLRAIEERTRADEQTMKATLAAASESRARVAAQRSAVDAIAAARRAEAAQAHESESRQRSDLIAAFMTETLRGVGPSVAMGRDTTMLKEMMDATAARIEAGALHAAPEAELTLRATIGRTYHQIAAHDDALAMLQPALALARAVHPGDHEATGAALSNLGALLAARGDLPGAESLLREAVAMRARLVPDDHPEAASDLQQLGHLRRVLGDLDDAESLLRDALTMQWRHVPGDHVEAAKIITSLGAVLADRGDLQAAEQCHREALAMMQRLHPGDHPFVANALNNLGRALRSVGDLDGGERMLRSALGMQQRLYAGDHAYVAIGQIGLGDLLMARKDLAAAEPMLRDGVAMARRLFPAGNPDLAAGLGMLGNLLRIRGDFAGAEQCLLEALEQNQRLFAGDHRAVATSLTGLGATHQARGDLAGAEACHRDALAMWQRLHPADHPDVATSLQHLGRVLGLRGSPAEAEPLLAASLEMRQRLFPSAHPLVLGAKADLAEALWQQGKSEPGVRMMHDVLAAARATLPKDSPVLAGWLATLGLHLLGTQSCHDAEPLLREALAIRERGQPDHWSTFHTRSMLGGALLGQQKLAEAGPLLLDGYRGMKERAASIPQQGAPRVLEALERLVRLHEARGRPSEAAAWRRELDAAKVVAAEAAMTGGK